MYDLASRLPEFKQLSFEYSESPIQYGRFIGGNVYVNFSGDLNTKTRYVNPALGWIIFDRSSDTYCLFTSISDGSSYIISIDSFEQERLIADWYPLYDLLSKKFNNLRDSLILDDCSSTLTETAQFQNIQPEQIGSAKTSTSNLTDADLYNINNVQAIIYSIRPEDISASNILNEDKFDMLLCFQQPESIQFTAASSYESSSPRGSQIPFQFYQQANQIDMSFTLKWHFSELKTLGYTSLESIAKMAEDFTRPWQFESSIRPKLCRVILPSRSAAGYISSASITYTGSMYGKSVQSVRNDDTSYNTSYGYDQLEVTFTLITIKDNVELKDIPTKKDSSNKSSNSINNSDATLPNQIVLSSPSVDSYSSTVNTNMENFITRGF